MFAWAFLPCLEFLAENNGLIFLRHGCSLNIVIAPARLGLKLYVRR